MLQPTTVCRNVMNCVNDPLIASILRLCFHELQLQVFKDNWNIHQRAACMEATGWGELLLLHVDEALDGGTRLHQELWLHSLQGYVPRNNSSDRLGHFQSLDKGSSDQS